MMTMQVATYHDHILLCYVNSVPCFINIYIMRYKYILVHVITIYLIIIS